jgi:hypothetical protein
MKMDFLLEKKHVSDLGFEKYLGLVFCGET